MADINDILTTVRERREHEAGVNQAIAEEILKDPAAIADVSIKRFAARVGVSEPSIIRYCRSVGCNGFKEFKKHLAQSLVIEQKFKKGEGAKSIGKRVGKPVDERLERVTSGILRALRSISDPEHAERIDQAARLLSTCSGVLALGVGGSSAALAAEAQNRFFRLGLRATSQSDAYMQRMYAATLGKSDVVVLISSTGLPVSLLESARIAKSREANVIGLGPAQSPMESVCDILIPIELDESIPYHQPNPVRYAQLFVLDCIADRVALLMGKPAIDALRRVSSSIASLQSLQPFQPTGD